MRLNRLLLLVLIVLAGGISLALIARPATAAPARLSVVSARLAPGTSWPVAAPVTLTVQFDQNVLLASWQWVGTDGRPVPWVGSTLPAQDLRPQQNTWVGRAAAPPVPGTYGIQVIARAANTPGPQTFTLNLRGTVVAGEGSLTRGLVYVHSGNLWLRSPDLRREQAVTYYGHPGNASQPAWSPDGRRIAFIRDRGTIDSGPELWVINPDGTAPRAVSTPSPGHSLGYPVFGADGTLYVSESRELTFQGVDLGDTWDVARVDLATGRRTPVLAGALMPDVSPDGKRMVYIQQTINSDGSVEQGLSVADVDGRNDRLLVAASTTATFYAPSWSPDGKTIAFASTALGPPPLRALGLAAPLLHGGIWDLWAVPAAGGTPTMLSPIQEDLPYPRWAPDGSRVLFISPTGIWSVPAAGGAAVHIADYDEHSELTIWAPVERRAPILPGSSRCFTETGHCLHGIFRTYWEQHGGLVQFGFPITDELIEDGRTVQYTERARLEWHPEYKGTPSEVLLGRLGADMADARAAAGEAPFQRTARTTGGGRFFPETGHTLAPALRGYWESHGGLPVFGYPLSEAFQERSPSDGKVYLVQYCERNRLEYHPEYAGTDSEVLLGLLGVQEHARRYGP
jgi:Tol biopolymer transport system component